MRKSSEVSVGFLSRIAEMLLGPSLILESRYCVDQEGKIVPDSCCENSALGTQFHWVYGGSSRGKMGDTVEGGNREPTAHNPGFGIRHGGGG